MGSMNDKWREILEILRCDIINSVEDTTISITEEEIRQREFINQAISQIKAIFQSTKLTKEEIEEIIINSDLYQNFISEYVDYSGTEKRLAQAIIDAQEKKESEG